MAKKTRDPIEELVLGCLGPILALGFIVGLGVAGIVWLCFHFI